MNRGRATRSVPQRLIRPGGRVTTVLLAGVVFLLPLLAACSKHEGKALPAPKSAETTTTTDPVDLTQVSLTPIALTGKETTTTRPIGGGKASLFGRVVDSDGNPVGYAIEGMSVRCDGCGARYSIVLRPAKEVVFV